MIKRATLAACLIALLSLGLLAVPALAADALRGRSPATQAAMDAALVPRRGATVQVLNQVCERPRVQRRCSPMSATLQRALDAAIVRPIVWVDERQPGAQQFWVFAPVRFGAEANAEYAWWDPGTFGCFGGAGETWTHLQGTWNPSIAFAYEGCPAT
jgi:hypothetical protein